MDHPARRPRRHDQGAAVGVHRRSAHHASVPAPLPTPGPGCAGEGTTGEWNAFNGESGGWRTAAFDLSAYADKRVDVKVSYVANADTAGKNGIGVFVDDTRVTTTGGDRDVDGFEGRTSRWTAEEPPLGSPPATAAASRSDLS